MVIINKLQNGWDVGPLQLWLSHFLVELQPQLLFCCSNMGEPPIFLCVKSHQFVICLPKITCLLGVVHLRYLAFHRACPFVSTASLGGRSQRWRSMSRSTCHAQRPEVSCREVLKLGNNKKDEERRKCIAPITNYQHLSTIILYVWNGMKIHRAWEETCGKSRRMNLSPVIQPSETSDQTQIISDPFPPQKKKTKSQNSQPSPTLTVALQQSVRSMDPWPAGTTSRTCAEGSWPRRPHGDK